MIVVTAVCLFVHPTSGGALLVLALGGSLAAGEGDEHLHFLGGQIDAGHLARERERKKSK